MCGIAFALVKGDVQNVIESLKGNVSRRGPDSCLVEVLQFGDHSLVFINSLLQMQGLEKRAPILKDSTGNILLWNGEVYSGLDMEATSNDGDVLLNKLSCSGSNHFILTLSALRGPWAFIYYDKKEQVVWWGRDFMGRKSLIFRGGFSNTLLTITSVASYHDENFPKFSEISPGIYKVKLEEMIKANSLQECPPERVPWLDDTILQLSCYPRHCNVPKDNVDDETLIHAESSTQELLSLLLNAVSDRCTTATFSRTMAPDAPHFMLLFSGGVDSTLLAALLHKALPTNESIELCSICFAQGNSPDRFGALDAFLELKSLYPDRDWKFIAVNSSYEELKEMKGHIVDLLYPSDTMMDFNIGGALWLAARGKGSLIDVTNPKSSAIGTKVLDKEYQSQARVIFLGHGADELFGGYGRHRTKYNNNGWSGLAEELRLDVKRLWQRNFGRDDRIVSDHGKESRIPFVDERIIHFALNADLQNLVDLRLPIGTGDKIILRRCLKSLGLIRASERHKRALQFGSRLAKAANKDAFGSNAAANKRHGGKVKLSDCFEPSERQDILHQS